MTDTAHASRINKELLAAGMSKYGLTKATTGYLPSVIHKDEHIGGVVYGRYPNGFGMLVATDFRVIFLDKKPMFVTEDEITYDVVSGFKMEMNLLFSTATLHTRIKDYSLKYVSRKCAKIFQEYIEKRQLEGTYDKASSEDIVATTKVTASMSAKPFPFLTDEAIKFMQSVGIGVLSTVNKKGDTFGSVVYFSMDEQHRLYILTKADTGKAINILKHPQVSMTIFVEEDTKTLQLQGIAEIETDEKIKRHIFDKVMKPRKYKSGYRLPPVAWIDAGMFVIITITPTSANFSDFSKK